MSVCFELCYMDLNFLPEGLGRYRRIVSRGVTRADLSWTPLKAGWRTDAHSKGKSGL